MRSRLTPDKPFPENLETLPTKEVEVLTSKVHHELEFEYEHNLESDPQTEFRLEHLHDELDIRELLDDDEYADPGHERITG